MKIYENEDFYIYNVTTTVKDALSVSGKILILDDTLDSIDLIKLLHNEHIPPILLTDSIPLNYGNEIIFSNNSYFITKNMTSFEYEIRKIIENEEDIIQINPYIYLENTDPFKSWAKSFTFFDYYDRSLRKYSLFDYSQELKFFH